MIRSLLEISWTTAGLIVLSTLGIYLSVIIYTKIVGHRSLAKMTSFDFAATVAIGSLVGSVALTRSSLAEGMFALAMLYGLQFIVAFIRRYARLKHVVESKPLLLMANGKMLQQNLNQARITREDVYSCLRRANVRSVDSVRAVILEVTGDMSVIDTKGEIDQELLKEVTDGHKII